MKSFPSSRRQFFKLSAAALTCMSLPQRLLASSRERRLALYNQHTGESLRLLYWQQGNYMTEGLNALNHFMRDYRTGDVHTIKPTLFDQLYLLQQLVAAPGTYHVISGYRSPKTNQLLQMHSSGVAKKSLHMQGMAIDICLPGKDLAPLHQAAINMHAGGVGYYPQSNFIHPDVGRVRHWG